MAVRLRFSFYGDVQVDRTLARFEHAPEDLRPVWRVLQQRFLVAERRQFASQGAYGSGGWAPLSPVYASWKARHFPGKTILRRTDELFRSLTEGPQIAIVEPRSAIFGSAVDHGAYHQAGGPNLPQRRPVELPESERREWVKVMQKYLATGGV